MKTLFALFLAYFLLPLSVSAQAYGGECGSCVDRKQRMCADECELVKPGSARKCQQDCIAEYCSHKCETNAPELEAYLQENCEECLEKQYVLCEAHCPEGRPRKRAACQLSCSDERCASVCEQGSEKKSEPKRAPKAANNRVEKEGTETSPKKSQDDSGSKR